MGGRRLFVLLAAIALIFAPAAAADGWWPHASAATWTYEWTDSVYNTAPTKEKVTVDKQTGKSFRLDWTTQDQGNPDGAPGSVGFMDFQETTAGLLVGNFNSSLPPPDFPVLCPQIAPCDSALTSTLYFVLWGSTTLLTEPLVTGTTWTGSGLSRYANPVSRSTYEGVHEISVRAFPSPVRAAQVRTDVTQAGALGDPYGSGVRTVWWVYGVGPVKMQFQHAGGTDAPVTTSELISTNQTPKDPPPDANYFPLKQGETLTYRWTNRKHFKKPSVQRFTLDKQINNSARFVAQDVSGPIRVRGSYVLALRLDGLNTISTDTAAATLVKFPPLGPRSLPRDQHRHFFTPFDLMLYGFSPVLPSYPSAGNSWASKNPSRDFSIFGVNGSARVLGTQTVKVPAGTFHALAVRSTLKQPGYPFGSGTRTSWFAPGRGLVKLVFRHGDGSTSVVELLK